MPAYDKVYIQQFADKLLREATVSVFLWTAIGAMLAIPGGVALHATNFFGSAGDDFNRNVVIGLSAVLGAMIGYTIGFGRVMLIRAVAMLMHCMVQIEQNTRAK